RQQRVHRHGQGADRGRRQYAHGDVIIVRYADDCIVGFAHRDDAERFWSALRDRLGQCNLERHPEPTRLIEFGRFAVERRKRCAQGKPEPCDLLGFTHIWRTTRQGKGTVRRKTIAQRLRCEEMTIQMLVQVMLATALALLLLAVPPGAHAQRTGTMPAVGVLNTFHATPSHLGPLGPELPRNTTVPALRLGLRDLGYVEGQTIALEFRFAEGRPEVLPQLAAELVHRHVDVLVANGPAAVRAAC